MAILAAYAAQRGFGSAIAKIIRGNGFDAEPISSLGLDRPYS